MRYNEIKLVEDIINEIDMSPSNLTNLVKNIDANIGIEFEFIYQASYDVEYTDVADTDSYSIGNITNFFYSSEIEQDDGAMEELYKRLQEGGFSKEKYPMMSDVYDAFHDDIPDLLWPQEQVRMDIDDVATYFKNYVGDQYTATTDSSIRKDDPLDIAIEIVTDGAMPLPQALSELQKAKEFISNNGYTNESCGLHINVSLANFKQDYIKNIDYLKLVLLLGDKYILEMFERESNEYAEPAFDALMNSASDADIDEALKDMRYSLNNLAGKIIHDGYTKKYISVNMHHNRVEFRGVGGHWLEKLDDLINIIKRMVVALDAALDETKYSKEYAKKLYKFLKPYSEYDDVTAIFAKYYSGAREVNVRRIKKLIANRNFAKRGHDYDANKTISISERYWVFAAKDLSYVWGSGKTKGEAFENSRPHIMGQITDQQKERPNVSLSTLWNAEIRDCDFFLTNRETHDQVQELGTFPLVKKKTLYVKAKGRR